MRDESLVILSKARIIGFQVIVNRLTINIELHNNAKQELIAAVFHR